MKTLSAVLLIAIALTSFGLLALGCSSEPAIAGYNPPVVQKATPATPRPTPKPTPIPVKCPGGYYVDLIFKGNSTGESNKQMQMDWGTKFDFGHNVGISGCIYPPATPAQ